MFFTRRKRVECAEHGHGEPAFACQRIAAGTALLSFTATDQKSHWPDAWCERCELERVSGTEEFTCLEQLCHHCYEKAHAAKSRMCNSPPKNGNRLASSPTSAKSPSIGSFAA